MPSTGGCRHWIMDTLKAVQPRAHTQHSTVSLQMDAGRAKPRRAQTITTLPKPARQGALGQTHRVSRPCSSCSTGPSTTTNNSSKGTTNNKTKQETLCQIANVRRPQFWLFLSLGETSFTSDSTKMITGARKRWSANIKSLTLPENPV